ncbi:MAG: hypothetical protein AB1813_24995, partial [Verrucomicrobiota bacterium]
QGEYVGVAISGNYAYLADLTEGLQIMDVSVPANTRRLGGIKLEGQASDVTVIGHYALVATLPVQTETNSSRGGLELIDVSNPAQPKRLSGNSSLSGALRIDSSSAGLILAAGESDTFAILDLAPFFTSVSLVPGGFNISWQPFGPTKLQSSSNLSIPDWREIEVSEAASGLIVPPTNAHRFFRLFKTGQ